MLQFSTFEFCLEVCELKFFFFSWILDSDQSRKALRALKGLVKLQALVRGYLVRKQATATLHSMQALIRAQATVRAQKARGLIKKETNRFEIRARKSMVIRETPILKSSERKGKNTSTFSLHSIYIS